jgi:hypothetical protein
MLALVQLSEECGRVLGSLAEKALTTPQQYPLTLAALVAASNQTSNREPVVNYDERIVKSALDALKDLRLVRSILPSHGRSVVRYRHNLEDTFGLDRNQCALLSMLLLRGPQTIAELRTRTERMSPFDGLDEVVRDLDRLAALDDPLAINVGRQPGQKEERWATPLIAAQAIAARDAYLPPSAFLEERPGGAPGVRHGTAGIEEARPSLSDRMGGLSADLADLRSEVAELRRQFDELRTSLGD